MEEQLFDPIINISDLVGYPFSFEKDYDDILIFYTGAFGGLSGPLEENNLYKASVFVKKMVPFYLKCSSYADGKEPDDDEEGVVSSLDLWDWLQFSGARIHSFRGSPVDYSNAEVIRK